MNHTEVKLNIESVTSLSDLEFFQLCQANEQYKIERDQDKNIVIMAPTGSETSEWNASLLFEIKFWCKSNNKAAVFDSSGGFVFPNQAILSPDITVISREKWQQVPATEKKTFAQVVPDFVVEIRSISDNWNTLESKMEQYMLNGVTSGWLIDPYKKQALLYEAGKPTKLHDDFNRPLSGSGILDGFKVVLAEVFDL
jgi:Uma2 family endonuclease